MIKVYGPDGVFLGLATVNSDEMCKACGETILNHGVLGYIVADHGNHITCNLKDGK